MAGILGLGWHMAAKAHIWMAGYFGWFIDDGRIGDIIRRGSHHVLEDDDDSSLGSLAAASLVHYSILLGLAAFWLAWGN